MKKATSGKMIERSWSQRTRDVAPAVTRVTLALVFLYFGFTQLRDPVSFVGWLPAEAAVIPVPAPMLIILNGAFEVFCGTILLLGVYTRVSAALLGLHLCAIAVSMGFTQTAVRDYGLAFASIAISLYGADRYTFDVWFTRKNAVDQMERL